MDEMYGWLGSSQRLPRTMCAWERMHNFIILKIIYRLKAQQLPKDG